MTSISVPGQPRTRVTPEALSRQETGHVPEPETGQVPESVPVASGQP